MAVTSWTAVDVSHELAMIVGAVDGVRVYEFVSDTTRPPACVISQPTIDYESRQGGFCSATWLYTLAIVVARSDDKQAQQQLSRLVNEIATALDSASVAGLVSIEPLVARPTTTSVGGSDLPAYSLQVRVRV